MIDQGIMSEYFWVTRHILTSGIVGERAVLYAALFGNLGCCCKFLKSDLIEPLDKFSLSNRQVISNFIRKVITSNAEVDQFPNAVYKPSFRRRTIPIMRSTQR